MVTAQQMNVKYLSLLSSVSSLMPSLSPRLAVSLTQELTFSLPFQTREWATTKAPFQQLCSPHLSLLKNSSLASRVIALKIYSLQLPYLKQLDLLLYLMKFSPLKESKKALSFLVKVKLCALPLSIFMSLNQKYQKLLRVWDIIHSAYKSQC